MSERRNKQVLLALLAFAGSALLASAHGQAVSLSGMHGTKALLVVDGSAPKVLGPGESFKGVKLLSVQGETAMFDIAGQRHTLRVGDSPVNVGQVIRAAGGVRVVLSPDSDGHFVTQGHVNSKPVQFMVDTGATSVGMGVSDANRIGLKYQDGQRVQVATANGNVPGWRIKLSTVRVGDIEVREIDAIVTPLSMPFVLLGNSFLSRFQMTRTNEQMVLEKRF